MALRQCPRCGKPFDSRLSLTAPYGTLCGPCAYAILTDNRRCFCGRPANRRARLISGPRGTRRITDAYCSACKRHRVFCTCEPTWTANVVPAAEPKNGTPARPAPQKE